MATNGLEKVVQHLRSIAFRQEAARMTDKQLLDCYLAKRDETAFAVLVRRHGPLVWNVCRRILPNHHDAEDAFQATFHVLVRKASSIVSRELLANWLYGVAHRTALKARAALGRRQARERQVVDMPEAQGAEPDLWSNLLPLLDQELSRLPEKYRAAIVLCDLEGKTRKEAARLLRLPEGTVASRLTRGRAMLATRLSRHGLAVSGGTLAAVVSQNAASACVPASVVWGTIKAATLLAAGQAAAAGAMSAKVAALTEGVVRAMFLTKLKTTMVALLVGVSAVGIGGGLLRYGLAAGKVERNASLVQGPEQKPKQEKKDSPKPGAIQKEGEEAAPVGEVKAPDILKAFETNAALFDEKFNEKRVAVTGMMTRIFRNKPAALANPGYVLEMVCGEPEPWVVVRFQFTDKDRKELAQFAENQMLTIEGQCQVKPWKAPVEAVTGGGLPGFPGPQGLGLLGGLPGFPGQPMLGGGLGPGGPPQPDIIFLNSKVVHVGKVMPPVKDDK